MGRRSREKGKRGEREWAAYLTEQGMPAHRGVQHHGGPDSPDVRTPGDDRFHFEVKRVERLHLHPAIAQAEDDARESGKVPVVAYRRNRSPWLVVMRACDFVDLAAAREVGE